MTNIPVPHDIEGLAAELHEIKKGMMTRGQTALTASNLVTSGGSVVLLVTALQVLGQHGDELQSLRDNIDGLKEKLEHSNLEKNARLIRVESDHKQLFSRVENLKRLATDPRARPDSWTQTDDRERMTEYDSHIKTWVNERLLQERLRSPSQAGALSMRGLIEIQHAIAALDPTDDGAWTDDGKPRVDRIEAITRRQLSESDRDRAWALMQTAATLRP